MLTDRQKIAARKIKHSFSLCCFGVKISISTNRAGLLDKIKRRLPQILPVESEEIDFREASRRIDFLKDSETGKVSVFIDQEAAGESVELNVALDLLASKVRLTVAEFAERIVFLHAGVIGWKGRAIIIPGKSFAGKTTLVAEFARKGCAYFSDEYALLDRDGLVHPFPKKLSLRGIAGDYEQSDFDVERLGGRRARAPAPVGWILLTEYHKTKRSELRRVNLGEGLMACLANSISVRRNPRFVLEVLERAARRTTVLKAARVEAAEFVEEVFRHFSVSEQSTREDNSDS